MAILIVNDDGVNAVGINVLAKRISRDYETIIVAPDREQSSVGHAITLSTPLRINYLGNDKNIKKYCINGTPADCVKLALKVILKGKPDLLISGINHGYNLGVSLIYSGTVSAATEGTMLKIPSIAVSLGSTYKDVDFAPSAETAFIIGKKVLENGLPTGVFLNVNVPLKPLDELKGYKITRQADSYFDDFFEKRIDPQGSAYFWISGILVNMDSGIDTDIAAVKEGYVSITPVKYDLTEKSVMASLSKWLET